MTAVASDEENFASEGNFPENAGGLISRGSEKYTRVFL